MSSTAAQPGKTDRSFQVSEETSAAITTDKELTTTVSRTQHPAGRTTARQFQVDPRLAASEIGRHSNPLVVRLFERAFAAVALIGLCPVMLFLAILIRRGSPGPALYVQKRVGINGRLYDFYKFRSCYHDSPQRWPELYSYNYTADNIGTLNLKIPNDPRITKEGYWLRRTTLDELPNLWNVVKGDIGLVGPRPEVPQMLPYYSGEMLLKFSVRPGLTGMAQISGRGHLSFLETVALDVEYVKARSLRTDLKILLMTAYKAITQEGAK
jgi:lipopolysaccharide/colanic/teichoic acid biosynthesis glycosyltransferase